MNDNKPASRPPAPLRGYAHRPRSLPPPRPASILAPPTHNDNTTPKTTKRLAGKGCPCRQSRLRRRLAPLLATDRRSRLRRGNPKGGQMASGGAALKGSPSQPAPTTTTLHQKRLQQGGARLLAGYGGAGAGCIKAGGVLFLAGD